MMVIRDEPTSLDSFKKTVEVFFVIMPTPKKQTKQMTSYYYIHLLKKKWTYQQFEIKYYINACRKRQTREIDSKITIHNKRNHCAAQPCFYDSVLLVTDVVVVDKTSLEN